MTGSSVRQRSAQALYLSNCASALQGSLYPTCICVSFAGPPATGKLDA